MHFFPLALQPDLGHGRLHETFRLISVTRSRIVGRTGDHARRKALYLYTNTEKTHTPHKHQTSMPEAGFEPSITASERAKTVHVLNHSATVTGLTIFIWT
jgi:hypothetical protein